MKNFIIFLLLFSIYPTSASSMLPSWAEIVDTCKTWDDKTSEQADQILLWGIVAAGGVYFLWNRFFIKKEMANC